MNIFDSSQTRCSFGSSVIRIVRPTSFCRCKGRAARGSPASQRYGKILSSLGVQSSTEINRFRFRDGRRIVSPCLIEAGWRSGGDGGVVGVEGPRLEALEKGTLKGVFMVFGTSAIQPMLGGYRVAR